MERKPKIAEHSKIQYEVNVKRITVVDMGTVKNEDAILLKINTSGAIDGYSHTSHKFDVPDSFVSSSDKMNLMFIAI